MTINSLSRQLSGFRLSPEPKILSREIYAQGRSRLDEIWQKLDEFTRADNDLYERALQGDDEALASLFKRSNRLDQRVFQVLARESHMPFIAKLLVIFSRQDDKEAVDLLVYQIENGNALASWALERLVDDGDSYARIQLERVRLKKDIEQQALWMDAAAYRTRIEEFVALTNESPGEDYLLFYFVSDALRKKLEYEYSEKRCDWYAHFMDNISDKMLVELDIASHFRQSLEESYLKPLCLTMQAELAKIVLENQKKFGFREAEPVVQRSREVLRVNSCV